jgi:hypothetical protein
MVQIVVGVDMFPLVVQREADLVREWNIAAVDPANPKRIGIVCRVNLQVCCIHVHLGSSVSSGPSRR